MWLLVVALALALVPGIAFKGQEERKTPKDSIKLVVTGCLKGRVVKASQVVVTDDPDAPAIDKETFRLSGPKTLMAGIKDQDGRRVSVTGLVRKIDLREPGLKFKGGRIVIGGSPGDPGRPPLPETADRPVVLEVISFEPLAEPCATGN